MSYFQENLKSAIGVIGKILLFPIRVVFFPVEMFLRWRDAHEGLPADSDLKLASKPSKSQKAPHDFFGAMQYWSRKIVSGSLSRLNQCNRIDLLLGLLPLSMLAFLGFVLFQVYAHADDIESRYRQGAQAAMDANDIPRAKTFFTRIVNEHQLSDQDRLNWAMILSNTGEPLQAQQVLDELAPDDRLGFLPAHRVKALSLAAQLGRKQDAETLRKLHSQLEFVGDNSPQINHAWALYYLAVDQTDTALGYLGAAAKADPQFLLMIADINERKGRQTARDRALKQAEEDYRRVVARDPLNVENRVKLARVLARLKKYKEAEQTLRTGLRLTKDIYLRQAAADYYVMRYDLASRDGKPFSEQFAFLQKALTQDETYLTVYERLIQLYQRQADKAEAASIKAALMQAVAGDEPSAMAHFALSNLYWIEGDLDKAQWHVRQAYELDPEFVLVINNLAWMMAHKEDPDLERALTLAETALKTAPEDPRFLDTYGSILVLQEKYDDAITALQKALPTNDPQVSKSIHEQLAVCYEAINQPELAKLHYEKVNRKSAPPLGQNKRR